MTTGEGKSIRPVYPTLKSFYDYEKMIREIEEPDAVAAEKAQAARLANAAANYNKEGG